MFGALTLLLSGCTVKETVDDTGGSSVPNDPPSTPRIELGPLGATSNDDLVVTITEESVDPDGDAVSYEYAWLLEGTAVEGLTDSTLPASETKKGETWTVEVYPTDGKERGNPARSTVTLNGSAPTLSVQLSPEVVRTNDTITATVDVDDPDGDAVNVSWTWLINGVGTGPSDPDLDGSVWFQKGDVVGVTATATDSDGLISTARVELTIGNTPPESPELEFSAIPPIAGADLTCLIATEPHDEDPADSFTYTFAWAVDGVPFTGTTSTDLWPNDTVPGFNVLVGQRWTCSVVANDGTDDGPAVSIESLEAIPWQGPRLFTSCGATGPTGPDQAACDTEYTGTTLEEDEYTVSAGIQEWIVPLSGDYTIEACGAQGASGTTTYVGGKGACVTGTFALTAGESLYIAVGQIGLGKGSSSNGGGGGGTFVVGEGDVPLLIAGGGGGTRASASSNGCPGQADGYATQGSGYNSTWACPDKTTSLGEGGVASSSSWGSGGAGFNSNGSSDGSYGAQSQSWFSGLAGGQSTYSCGFAAHGGFGGGGTGQGCYGGGGGGGYSGGDGGWIAGGGGSYNAGTDPSGTDGANEGDGYVIIDYGI